MNMLDENIEATRFVADISQRADSMKLFPGRVFQIYHWWRSDDDYC